MPNAPSSEPIHLGLAFNRQDLNDVLAPEHYSAEKLVGLFQRGITPPMYDTSVDVFWGSKRRDYTLADHTLRVLKGFDHYFSHKPLPGGVSKDVFRVGLTVHDIGKTKRGSSSHITLPIAQAILQALEYSPTESKVISALLCEDPIGRHLMNFPDYSDPDFALEYIEEMAEIAEMPLNDFFELLLIYYTVDASSYEHLEHLFVYRPELGIIESCLKIQKAVNTFRQKISKITPPAAPQPSLLPR